MTVCLLVFVRRFWERGMVSKTESEGFVGVVSESEGFVG